MSPCSGTTATSRVFWHVHVADPRFRRPEQPGGRHTRAEIGDDDLLARFRAGQGQRHHRQCRHVVPVGWNYGQRSAPGAVGQAAAQMAGDALDVGTGDSGKPATAGQQTAPAHWANAQPDRCAQRARDVVAPTQPAGHQRGDDDEANTEGQAGDEPGECGDKARLRP